MDHKDTGKQDLQQAMAKDFDKLVEKDEKKASDETTQQHCPPDTPPPDTPVPPPTGETHEQYVKRAKKEIRDAKASAMHPEYIPEFEARSYESFYFNLRGKGFQIRDANHHIDYATYVAYSPMAFGIETAPGVPVPEPTPLEEKKVATEVKTKE